MRVYEMTFKVFLLKNIHNTEALEKISELIDKSLSREEELLNFHNDNKFKNYTLNSFFPLEKDKIYKEGNIYSIKIRTIDEKVFKFFKTNLVNEYTNFIKVLTVECKLIGERYIEKIYSITPMIIKTDNGYWKGNLSVDDFEKRIKENLVKKYNAFFNEKLDENFELFHMIKFENQKPISCKYKNVHILADKITVTIAENKIAQSLAYLALGTGIGEMNARGYGFVNYKYL